MCVCLSDVVVVFHQLQAHLIVSGRRIQLRKRKGVFGVKVTLTLFGSMECPLSEDQAMLRLVDIYVMQRLGSKFEWDGRSSCPSNWCTLGVVAVNDVTILPLEQKLYR